MGRNQKEKYKQEFAVHRIRKLNEPWKEIKHWGTRKSFPKNTELTDLDEDVFYLLEKGLIRISALNESGNEITAFIVEKGVIINEIPHFHTSLNHSHSLRTISQCETIAFPKHMLTDVDFCREYPHLILNLLRSLAIKSGAQFAKMYDSQLFDNKTLFCRALIQIWRENGETKSLCPDLCQADLDEMLGIHRSNLCSIIKTLRHEGIIGKFTKKRLDILDHQKLLEYGKVS